MEILVTAVTVWPRDVRDSGGRSVMAEQGGTCEIVRGRASETADAKSKRAARTVAEPVLDAGWSIEYSVHRLTPATMEDARVCFSSELEEEVRRFVCI